MTEQLKIYLTEIAEQLAIHQIPELTSDDGWEELTALIIYRLRK